MSGAGKLFSSVPVLLGATLVLLTGSVGAIFPVADYIGNESLSTTTNFYLIGAVMFGVALASAAEAMLVVRLIWGRGAVSGTSGRKVAEGEVETEVRSLKVTGTKKGLIFFVALAANILIVDQLGGGVLVTRTRHHHVLTQLRTTDAAARQEAADDAIQLVGDPQIAEALGRVIEAPGPAREWAAWSAGVRGDKGLKDHLAELLRTGKPRERAAAALSLARLEDPRLLRLVIDAFPGAGDVRTDLLIAVGMLGKRDKVTGAADLAEAGVFVAQQLESGELGNEATLVAIWALGQLEAPEGLPYLKTLMAKGVGVEAQCTALEALGQIGSAESSDWLVAMIDKADKSARCPEVVARDFTGHEVLVCGGINLVERIVREIANIGDRQARPVMERLANDESHSKTVRKMAAEIAFQMRYIPAQAQ
jgi:HEAT repeat protein